MADLKDFENRLDLLTAPEDPQAGAAFHFYADAGFNMLHPYFTSIPAYTVTRRAVPAGPPLFTSPDFDYDVGFGPRLTLGVVSANGLGFRSSWWQFELGTSTPVLVSQDRTLGTTFSSTPVLGLPGFTSPGLVAQSVHVFGDQLNFGDQLRFNVFDWDVTKNFHGDCWALLVAGGTRYAYLSQSYRAFRFNSGRGRQGTSAVNLLADSDSVDAGHNFGGVGPTAALEVRRRIGQTGLSVYGSARGSVLFGHEKMQGFQNTMLNEQITPAGGRTQTLTTSTLFQQASTGENTVPMADVEVGVDWARVIGRARLSFTVGFVDQTWFGVGTATAEDGHLGLLGLRCTAGINY
jgi:hypothetical protein